MDSKQVSILLIEHEQSTVVYLKRLLADSGYAHVMHAPDLETGFELLKERPGLILLSLALPDTYDNESVAQVRKIAARIPTIALTGRNDPSGLLQAIRSYIQDYLNKNRLSMELLRRVIKYTLERFELLRTIRFSTMHDSLTGLPNAFAFTNSLRNALGEARQNAHYQFSVLFVNIDSFNRINETFGHAVGDSLLNTISERLKETIRPGDVLARFNSDEFGILLQETNSVEETMALTEQIQAAMNPLFVVDDYELKITASIGIVYSQNGYDSAETMVRDADSALIRAKKMGKGRSVIFTPAIRDAAVRKMKVEADIRSGLAKDQFRVFYQPLFTAGNSTPFGFEALVRWEHPEQGLVSPINFIPVAEETEQIVILGEWVLRESCRMAQKWNLQFGTEFSIAVNISATQINRDDFIKLVASSLEESGLPAHLLKLEITESCIMEDVDEKIELLRELRTLGVRVLIDDFGTGYSSLSYLRKLEADGLKIDRSFVSDLPHNTDDLAIVRAIISMAEILKLNTVGEGVETPEQMEALQNAGCEVFQGYYLAHPMPAGEVEKFLVANGLPVGGTG